MKPCLQFFKRVISCLVFIPLSASADEKLISTSDVMTQRLKQEQAAPNNTFLISLYRPTYILPLSYTTKPYYEVYQANPSQQRSVNKAEVKLQISFKIPVMLNVFNHPKNTLYIAYTQQSYWQAYNDSAYFRESNYEPEIFLSHHIDKKLSDNWRLSVLNLGASHQSNGKGSTLERSWNRVYGEAILANSNWLLSLKPWFVVRDASYRRYNENLSHYLGYERILINYKYHDQVFSLKARNTIESNFERGAVQATWSFPITAHLRGYAELFSGYGQNLIEASHYTNNIGIGIALNDWI